MIHQDYEYEAQREVIYLQERLELLRKELREEAIIYALENKNLENADKQVASVQIVTPKGVQLRPNISAESDLPW